MAPLATDTFKIDCRRRVLASVKRMTLQAQLISFGTSVGHTGQAAVIPLDDPGSFFQEDDIGAGMPVAVEPDGVLAALARAWVTGIVAGRSGTRGDASVAQGRVLHFDVGGVRNSAPGGSFRDRAQTEAGKARRGDERH